SLPRARTGHYVTEILHATTFLEACVLLLYNCLNLSSQNRCTKDPVPMHEWLGSQIPDTAPYIEWLAIVCSVMAVFFFASPFSHYGPTHGAAPRGGKRGPARALPLAGGGVFAFFGAIQGEKGEGSGCDAK